jgi:hypothetical protein
MAYADLVATAAKRAAERREARDAEREAMPVKRLAKRARSISADPVVDGDDFPVGARDLEREFALAVSEYDHACPERRALARRRVAALSDAARGGSV